MHLTSWVHNRQIFTHTSMYTQQRLNDETNQIYMRILNTYMNTYVLVHHTTTHHDTAITEWHMSILTSVLHPSVPSNSTFHSISLLFMDMACLYSMNPSHQPAQNYCPISPDTFNVFELCVFIDTFAQLTTNILSSTLVNSMRGSESS